MKIVKYTLLAATLTGLFACSTPETPQKTPEQVGYLKNEISQAELNNTTNFKRYSYACNYTQTGETAYLAAYFPLWKESRLPENFGFYFQLNNGKAQPFDHLINAPLNAAETRFEVRYRSYFPIEGSYVELKAREKSSIYYKNGQAWLECQEG